MKLEMYINYSTFEYINQTLNESLLLVNQERPHVFEYNLWQKVMFSLFMFPIMFLSITGNILVVIAIVKYPYLRSTNNIFLGSLAIADCAVGILAMPPNALQLLSGHWYLKAFMCRFWFSCDVTFSTASILHLCCVSIDRYLSISDKYTFEYLAEHPTKSWRVRIMIASVWITSLLLSFIPIYTNLYTTSEQKSIIDSLDYENGQCAFVVNLPYRFISSFISFWIPAIGLVTFYSLMMKKAYHLENYEFKKYKDLKKRLSSVNQSDRNHENFVESSYFMGSRMNNTLKRDSTVVKNWKREYRLLKTLGIVIAVFCSCWFFFFLRYTMCGTTYNICPDFIAKNLVLEDILFWIGYFNSMINPFLYNFTNQEFRKAFKDLLNLDAKSKARSRSNTQSSNNIRIENSKTNCLCFKPSRSKRLDSNASSLHSNSRKTTLDEGRQYV